MPGTRRDDSLQKLQRMPRDRGWAWVVMTAIWLNYIMTAGVYKAFGILFLEIQDKFNSTAAKTSLTYSLINASFSATTLLIAIVDVKSISSRQFVVIGTTICSMAYIIAAFAPNVDILIVSLGIGLGAGQGFVWTPQVTLIGQYFDTRKGLANCLSYTGGSAGSLILPYVIGYFVDKYGFSGTMLLLAALSMNGFVFASLMRPFPMDEYNRLKAESEQLKESEKSVICESSDERAAMLMKNKDGSDQYNSKDALQVNLNGDARRRTSDSSPPIRRSVDDVSRITLYASSEFGLSSVGNIGPSCPGDDSDDTSSPSPTTLCEKLKSRLRTVINLNVLKIPVFLYYVPFAVITANGASMYLSFLLPHAKDKGLTASEIKSLLILIGVADIIAVPLWGALADRQYVRTNKLVMIAMWFLGIPACFISYYDSYGTILMFSAFYGVLGRVIFSLSAVILVELLGLEYLKSAVGLYLVIQSIFHSIMLPVVGVMRDELGTYEYGYKMMATFILVGSVGMVIMPELAVRIHGRPHNKTGGDIVPAANNGDTDKSVEP